ncbi:MAG: radical SAM protein [Halobacteriota archaeon]
MLNSDGYMELRGFHVEMKRWLYPLIYLYNRVYSDSWIRAQLPTNAFGARYTRSRSKIEIDVTYRCNLRCANCNRSCTQAPTAEQMTVEQVQQFIKESINRDVNWEKIRILGGEPTLHPELPEILSLLIEYKNYVDSDTRIVLVTNGYGSKVARTLSTVPPDVEIENSMKTSGKNRFISFNKAPRDSIFFKHADFSNGCWVVSECGIGLTPYGYYCCAVAGGIDRIFGFDLGRKELPPTEDAMTDHLRVFCELCGHFGRRRALLITSEGMSPTWKEAYLKYKDVKPVLSLYTPWTNECDSIASGETPNSPLVD